MNKLDTNRFRHLPGHSGLKLDKLVPYLFLMPFMISFVLFFMFPAVYSFVLSFFRYKGYGDIKYIGFDNYKSLLTYRVFWMSVRNTVFYFIVSLIPIMLLAFTFAYMLQSKFVTATQKIYKPVLFLPQIVPIVASSLIWRILLATKYGAVNQILGTDISFLTDSRYAKWSVIILLIWRSTGWFMIIYLAGLTTISEEVTDATKIDGANVIQNIWYVVLPMMKPIILFAFVMNAISSFKLFSEPNVLLSTSTGILLDPDSIPIMNVLLSNLNGANFGMASAAGWLIFLLVLIVAIAQFKLLSEKGE